MRNPATPTLDQLLVLLAVVETGSFTAAAKRLGRATSAVSYAIDTLERQLALSLFDRGTTRKPKLTQHGEAIVSSGDFWISLSLKCRSRSTACCRAID